MVISPVRTQLETKQSNFEVAWIYIFSTAPCMGRVQLEVVCLCLNPDPLCGIVFKSLFKVLECLGKFGRKKADNISNSGHSEW